MGRNLLMVLDSPFPPDIRVEKEAASLLAAGHTVHLLCARHDRSRPVRETVDGIKVLRVDLPLAFARKMLGLAMRLPLYRWFWRAALRRAVQEIQPDLMYVHDLPLALACLGPSIPGIPWVVDMHENYPVLLETGPAGATPLKRWLLDIRAWKNLEVRAAREAAGVVTISPENAARIERLSGRPVTVVPNTARLHEFAPVERPEKASDPVKLLYVGGIDPARDLETVVEGLALLKSTGLRWQCTIVGGGPSRAALQERVNRLGLATDIVFAGQVPQKDVARFCAAADIALLPLAISGQTDIADPNKLYQYLFFGMPVLAADVTSIRRLEQRFRFGRLYRSGDAGSWAAAAEEMIRNADAWLEQGRQASRLMRSEYHWDATVTPLLHLVERLR